MIDQPTLVGLITCHNCGWKDEESHCSRCGAVLRLGEFYDTSLLRTLYNNVVVVLGEVSDPIFAFFKTFWLVVMNPVSFFRALFYQETPVATLSFPLASLWRKEYQPALDPIKYALFFLVFAILLPSTGFTDTIFSQDEGIFNLAGDVPFMQNMVTNLTVQGVIFEFFVLSLLVIAGCAYLFHLPLRKGQLPHKALHNNVKQQSFLYWLYVFFTIFHSLFLMMAIFANIGTGSRGASIAAGLFLILALGLILLLSAYLFLVVPFRLFGAYGKKRVAVGLLLAGGYLLPLLVLAGVSLVSPIIIGIFLVPPLILGQLVRLAPHLLGLLLFFHIGRTLLARLRLRRTAAQP